jgi:hypothetical protein
MYKKNHFNEYDLIKFIYIVLLETFHSSILFERETNEREKGKRNLKRGELLKVVSRSLASFV